MDFNRMLRYCRELEKNNDRAWFHRTHDEYMAAKDDFTELVETVKYTVADHCAPALAERIIFIRPKDMLYRIPRDARVAKNKPPYNPTWRAYIAPDRHAMQPIGYFMMIAPGGRSHFGTGAWCPDAGWVSAMRSYIAENFERFDDALERSGLPLEGMSLKRCPRDFDPDTPWADYMRYKEWFINLHFDDGALQSFDGFAEEIGRAVERMEPFRVFFEEAFARLRRPAWDKEQWK